MKMNSVKDVRQFFVDELNDQAFTIDKTGARTIEMIGASFIADEASIFGTPSHSYIRKELESNDKKLDTSMPNPFRGLATIEAIKEQKIELLTSVIQFVHHYARHI